MNADGSNRRRLTDNQYEEGTPAWRPADLFKQKCAYFASSSCARAPRRIIDLVIDRDSEAKCDETVLSRALEREGRTGQVVAWKSAAAEAAGARRLIDYRVVYTTDGHWVTLEPDRKGWDAGERLKRAGSQLAQPDDIRVEATLIDSAGAESRVSMPVEFAILNPKAVWVDEAGIILSQAPRPSDADLEKLGDLIRHAIFNPWDDESGSDHEQQCRFDNDTHNLLATKLLGRTEALERIVERALEGVDVHLRTGERVRVEFVGTDEGTEATVSSVNTTGDERAAG